MKLETFASPRPHMIIDEFFTKDELPLALQEIKKLEPQQTKGLGNLRGEEVEVDIKKNNVVYLDEFYKEKKLESMILVKFSRDVWGEEGLVNREFQASQFPCFEYMKFLQYSTTQISIYGDGDFYGYHEDRDDKLQFMTVNVVLCNEPKQFTGGDFKLTWNGVTKMIPFKNNTAIIYPQTTEHCVTKVNCKDNNYDNRRYSLNHWCRLIP